MKNETSIKLNAYFVYDYTTYTCLPSLKSSNHPSTQLAPPPLLSAH